MKLFLLVFSILVMLPAYGAGENMSFKGTLIEPPPCVINTGKNMNVYFDKVGINKLDGVNYRQSIDYTLSCEDSPPWVMSLTVIGEAASFLSATVQSNVANLGIRIFIDGRPMELNKSIVINPASLPKLEAAPVKKMGAVLNEGKFSATATLLAQYQ